MTNLGELYRPTGKALETAQEVLECQFPYACNMAYGCTNCCQYPCFIPYSKPGMIRFPEEPAHLKVLRQLNKGLKPEAVFLSFETDALIPENIEETRKLVELFIEHKMPTAILSKIGVLAQPGVRSGCTIVSIDEEFWKRYEPKASSPISRINQAKTEKECGGYVWFSMEPYPNDIKWKQDISKVLNKIDFADFIIFGKWNYSRDTSRPPDREFYRKMVEQFRSFCTEKGIRHHVKSDTLKFIGEL